jgi:hypothetical protein
VARFTTGSAPVAVRPEYILDENTEHIGRCLCRLVDGKFRPCVYCCIKQLAKKRADTEACYRRYRPNFRFGYDAIEPEDKQQLVLCFHHTYYFGAAEVPQRDCEECWENNSYDYSLAWVDSDPEYGDRSDEERAKHSKSDDKRGYDESLGLDIVEEYARPTHVLTPAPRSRRNHMSKKRKPGKTPYHRRRGNYTIKWWDGEFKYRHVRLGFYAKRDRKELMPYEPWDPVGLRRRKDERDRGHFRQDLADYFTD